MSDQANAEVAEQQQQPQEEEQQQKLQADDNAAGGSQTDEPDAATNGAAAGGGDDGVEKCSQCELPADPEGLRPHLRRLLTQSVAGSLVEFDAIKKHWQNFGANLPGFIATPYCAHCRLHFQGFLRYAAHCCEAMAASSTDADTADADNAAAANDSASVAEHERRFEELITFVCNFTDEAVSAEQQKALAAGFLCPAGGQPNYDMFQLKADFVFANKTDGGGDSESHHQPQPQPQQQDVAPPLLACLLCQQPFRSLSAHLDDALWGLSTPIFRGRHNQIAETRTAHLRAWLGHDAMQQLQLAFSGGCTGADGGNSEEADDEQQQQQQPGDEESAQQPAASSLATPHCPVCGCHFAQQLGGGGNLSFGGGGVAGRLLLHLQHDIDTPGHRQLADQLRERLAESVFLQTASASAASSESGGGGGGVAGLFVWLGGKFACPHGGADPSNGIVEQLRASLDKRRQGELAAASAAAGGAASTGGLKRGFVGGGGGVGVGRKVARISRGGGGGGGYFQQPPYQHHHPYPARGGGGGWRRY